MADSDQQNQGAAPPNPPQSEPASATTPAKHPDRDESGIYRSQPVAAGEPGAPAAAPKKKSFPFVIVGFALLASILVGLIALNRPKKGPQFDADDLGAGIFKAAGLRGHLITRWSGKAQYQLEIKPLDPQQSAEFAFVVANPPKPLTLTIRILDAAGFTLCSKAILFHFDPTRVQSASAHSSHPVGKAAAKAAAEQAELQLQLAQELQREQGKDIFQNQLNADGGIEAINAQGDLPCSAKDYKHIDYWDFATDFPTLEEQDALIRNKKEMQDQQTRASWLAAKQKAAKKFVSAFYVQGDEHVSGYDSSRSLLVVGPGRSFFIDRKIDQPVAAGWAADSSLIHYKCDQRASCVLTHSGTSTVIYGRLNE